MEALLSDLSMASVLQTIAEGGLVIFVGAILFLGIAIVMRFTIRTFSEPWQENYKTQQTALQHSADREAQLAKGLNNIAKTNLAVAQSQQALTKVLEEGFKRNDEQHEATRGVISRNDLVLLSRIGDVEDMLETFLTQEDIVVLARAKEKRQQKLSALLSSREGIDLTALE